MIDIGPYFNTINVCFGFGKDNDWGLFNCPSSARLNPPGQQQTSKEQGYTAF